MLDWKAINSAVEEYDKNLGEQIRKLKESRKLTDEKMAEITNLTLRQYKMLENGYVDNFPTTDVILAIDNNLGVLLDIPFNI